MDAQTYVLVYVSPFLFESEVVFLLEINIVRRAVDFP